jgi:flagellar hook-length control protein FliK
VIAIVPQIATSGVPAAAPASPASSAGNVGPQSFSAALEQATPSQENSLGTQAGSTRGAMSGTNSPVTNSSTNNPSITNSSTNGLSKREAKPSDSKSMDLKTNDSQGHGNTSNQTSVSRSDAQDATVPILVVQTPISPALPWNMGIKDLTADAVTDSTSTETAANDKVIGVAGSTVAPRMTGESNLLPKLANTAAPAELQGDTNHQDSASTESVNSGNASAVASLITNLPGTVAADSKTQPVGAAANPQVRNASRSAAEATNSVSKVQAAVKSEIEQVLVPPAGVPATPISPTTRVLADVAAGDARGTQVKPVLDKSQGGATQDSLGTTGKNIDSTGGTKAQTRKDDSQSSSSFSSSSQTADQGMGAAPAKAVDPASSFSAAGIQAASTTGDAKSVSASVPHAAGDAQAGQLDQKSTGVAQSQTQGENAAAYPTSLVHSAKLVQSIGEAELRLGIRAGEFGSVDIRTSMVRNQFTAEISVERGELGRVMAAELPNLQNRLAEQRVPMASITLQNHTGSQSSASEQQKPRDGQPGYAMNSVSAREEGPMPALVALEGTAPASRLDIHM